MKGRATDLLLFDGNDRVLAKFGGSLQDFDAFLSELELHARSRQVTLFRCSEGKWEQRVNGGDWRWIPSEGPKLYRDMNRHLKYVYGVGLPLIVLAIAISYWLNHCGFEHLK